jgi:hypothetical protein
LLEGRDRPDEDSDWPEEGNNGLKEGGGWLGEDSDWLEEGNGWLEDGDDSGWEHEGLEFFLRGSIPRDSANDTKCQRLEC